MSQSYTPLISRELDVTQYKGIQAGKSRRISVFADNVSTYTSSSSTADIFFSLPAIKQGFIVSSATQLVFEVTANSTFVTDPVLSLANGNPNSLIQSMEVVCQNVQIEQLNNYNVYANIMADLQPLGRSTTMGTFNGATSTLKAGIQLNGATTVDGAVVRCAVPLYSAILGVGAEQFMPACDGTRVRLTCASTEVGLKFANITSYTSAVYKLSNIALQFEIMELDTMSYNALLQESGAVFKQHGMAVNNYQSVVTASTANSILIPARFSSVKALITCFRLSANLSAPAIYNSVGDRLLPQIQQYNFVIDAQQLPSVPIRVGASATSIYTGEVISELAKVFSASNSTAFDTVFNATQFNNLVGTSGTGSFILAQNFESMDSAGHALMSGKSLNSSNCYLNLTHYATALASVSDTFALYDIVVSYNMLDGSVSLSK